MPKSFLVQDTKSKNASVVDTRPGNELVLDIKPKGQLTVESPNFTYIIGSVGPGMWMGSPFLTYPTDFLTIRP